MPVTRFVSMCIAVCLFAAPGGLMAQSTVKVGVFDPARLQEETAEGRRIQAQLTGFRDKKQAELQAKQKEVADLQGQLTAQALSLSADKRSQMEKDLQRKSLDLSQAQEAATREMQMEIQEAQGRFEEQVLGIVEQFGREEGFTLILMKGLAAYAADSIDITTAIVDRINKALPGTAPGAAPVPPAPPPAGEKK